jgi:hypothetical protein
MPSPPKLALPRTTELSAHTTDFNTLLHVHHRRCKSETQSKTGWHTCPICDAHHKALNKRRVTCVAPKAPTQLLLLLFSAGTPIPWSGELRSPSTSAMIKNSHNSCLMFPPRKCACYTNARRRVPRGFVSATSSPITGNTCRCNPCEMIQSVPRAHAQNLANSYTLRIDVESVTHPTDAGPAVLIPRDWCTRVG